IHSMAVLVRQPTVLASGIRDNPTRGCVGDYLKRVIEPGADLSVVSAYFTIYAFGALKDELEQIRSLQFLFGEPRFVKALDPDSMTAKVFRIEEDGLQLANRLEQKRLARECADWLREKAEIRSIRRSNLLHGKMYHVAVDGKEAALVGSSNFTVSGLGLGAQKNLELNMEVDIRRDRDDLKAWFEEIWQNEDLVADVKEEVLLYLAQLYQNHAPEFIYYKTLFHLFQRYLADDERSRLLEQKGQLVDTAIWSALFEFQRDGV